MNMKVRSYMTKWLHITIFLVFVLFWAWFLLKKPKICSSHFSGLLPIESQLVLGDGINPVNQWFKPVL